MHYLACDLPGEAVQKRNAHRMWNNGQGWQAYGDLNLRTWYQSDLVTITDQAMTKHYFIAGQRIASKLAESFASEVVQNIKGRPIAPLSGEVTKLGTIMTERLRRDFECLGIDYNAFYPGEVKLEALETLLNAPEQPDEYQVFFYHSDHLGSSSFITDVNGDATQHLQYLPFGEDLVHEQNTAAYLSPYTFSGKERDVETNLSYFGARYYEAGLSIWLSVDPLSDKYPSLSAYNYCALNPVMLVDPDGMQISTHTDESGNVIAVYNDGDNGVYKHKNGTTKADLNAKHGALVLTNPTSAGGTKVGETLEWNSFLLDGDPNQGALGKIDFNSFEARDQISNGLQKLSRVKSSGKLGNLAALLEYAANANNGQPFDLKAKGGQDVENYYRGSQIKPGVYVSARDAGNLLAGMVGRMGGLSAEQTYSAFGALQLSGNNVKLMPLLIPRALMLGSKGSFGELQISHTFQRRGFEMNLK